MTCAHMELHKTEKPLQIDFSVHRRSMPCGLVSQQLPTLAGILMRVDSPRSSSGHRYHRVTTLKVYGRMGDSYLRAMPKSQTANLPCGARRGSGRRKGKRPQHTAIFRKRHFDVLHEMGTPTLKKSEESSSAKSSNECPQHTARQCLKGWQRPDRARLLLNASATHCAACLTQLDLPFVGSLHVPTPMYHGKTTGTSERVLGWKNANRCAHPHCMISETTASPLRRRNRLMQLPGNPCLIHKHDQ